MRFGIARFLEIHLMKIDCERYNRRNFVVVALDMVTSRNLAQRDILVGSQDVEGSIIHFFTLLRAEGPLDLKPWTYCALSVKR